jgi:hypothetical protein
MLPERVKYLRPATSSGSVFTSPGTAQMCVRDAIWKAPLDLQLPPAEVYLQAQPRDGKCIYKPSLGTGSVFTSPASGREVYLQAQARPRCVSEMRFGRHRSTSSYLQRKCIYKPSSYLYLYLQAQPRDGKCIYKPRHGPDVCPRCDLEGTARPPATSSGSVFTSPAATCTCIYKPSFSRLRSVSQLFECNCKSQSVTASHKV